MLLPLRWTLYQTGVQQQPRLVGNGGYDVTKEDVDRFIEFLKKRRQKEEVEVVEEIVEELEESAYSEPVETILRESEVVKPGIRKPVVDYQKLLQDIEAMKKLIALYQMYREEEEMLVLMLLAA